ncbi:MAG: GNAT family N-acetyltransferase [Cytophagales bacterium]|nr:GNAT family N-acetyltransferase [Cytophagales bacterium]
MNCQPIHRNDLPQLIQYFDSLSEKTRSFYGPHPFDEPTLRALCDGSYESFKAFVVTEQTSIIGYTVIKQGYSEGELYRYPNYDIIMDSTNHFLYAPSISDAHQSKGIGSIMLAYIENYLQPQAATHLVLWGGVQARNQRAIRYYEKNGFFKLGEFHYDGLDNWDMVKPLIN